MTTEVTQGAVAPGEVVDLTFESPPGVDFTAMARAVVCSLRTRQGSIALSPWTEISCTADELVVRFSPVGTEFVLVGAFQLLPELTLNGARYRYDDVPGTIVKR